MPNEPQPSNVQDPQKKAALQIITDERFNLLKSEDLGNERIFELLKNYIIHDICDSRDVLRAKLTFERIVQLLQTTPSLHETNAELFKKYLGLIAALKLTALTLLNTEEVRRFFSENLLMSLGVEGVSFKDLTKSYLLWEGSDKKVIGAIVTGIAENTELLGSQQIKVFGEDHGSSPSIKNWILDYNKSTATVSKRGAMERVTYLNQNVNVKQLKKEDKELLLKVLELYDWLRFGSGEVIKEVIGERAHEIAWPKAPLSSTLPAKGREEEERKKIGVVPGTPLKQEAELRIENKELGQRPIPPAPTSVPSPTSSTSPGLRPPSPSSGEGNKERILPPPPRPPKLSAESLGGQAAQPKPLSPLPTSPPQGEGRGAGFSINDALARAGENDKTKLTGGLPKKQ